MDFVSLIPQFGNLIWTLAAFVLALLVIVGVHEYGHYIVGRWSGIHADVFSLGFGPVLFSRTDRRGTVWQIAAVPLGGYVKFRGDANAASAPDADAMAQLPADQRRTTMPGAPLWARAATVAAGPAFNFVFSIIVLTGLALVTGTPSDPPRIAQIYGTPISGITLQPGDTLIEVDGVPFEKAPTLLDDEVPHALIPYTVERDGRVIQVQGPMLSTARIGFVQFNSAAEDAGLRVGDVIMAANGQPIWRFNELIQIVAASNGQPVALQIWRDGAVIDLDISPRRQDILKEDRSFETRWLLGVSSSSFFEPATEMPGPVEAFSSAVARTWDVAASSVSGLYHIAAQKISSCNMSGAITIAKTSGKMASSGLVDFIAFLAFLSTAIGLVNLFPIPVLDGGHLMFYAYEAVVGRGPSEKVVQVLMSVGLVIVLSIMVFALSNDLFC